MLQRKIDPLMSNINITPFVDVMLVLLAIFMITAPLITIGAQVQLPKANQKPIVSNNTPVVITLQKSGNLYVGKKPVILKTLVSSINKVTHIKNSPIYLRADRMVMYQNVIRILSVLNQAGYLKVSLITLPK